jgi:hypothetical protein
MRDPVRSDVDVHVDGGVDRIGDDEVERRSDSVE